VTAVRLSVERGDVAKDMGMANGLPHEVGSVGDRPPADKPPGDLRPNELELMLVRLLVVMAV
jgi:hypothetical protein